MMSRPLSLRTQNPGRKNSKSRVRSQRRAFFEALETRDLLTVLYWDPDGITANNTDFGTGAGLGGGGAWITGAGGWVTAGNTPANWTAGDDAIFFGTAGAVAIDAGGVTANSLTFKTTGYSVASNTLTLTGSATATVDAGVTATMGSTVSGGVALLKSGPGTLVLTAANNYTGGTTISQGELRAAVGSVGAGLVTLNDAATGANNTAYLATGIFTVPNNFVVANQGSGVSSIGTTTFASAAATLFTGTVQLNRATTLRGGNADRTTFQGVISGNVGTLTVAGGARVTSEPTNTFVGDVAITGAGTILQIGPSTNVIPDASNVNVGAGAFLYFNTAAETIAGLNGAGTVQKHPGVGGLTTFTVGSGNANGTFTGAIANGGGTVALVKTGTGTQSLNGASSYTAGTTISQGVLQVGVGAGAGTGAVTLNDASTGANNTSFLATAAITVANPITIAPQGTGVSTIGTTDFNPGAVGTFFTNTVTANQAVTFQGGNTDRTTYQGQITGAGPITISSANPAGRRTTWENNTNNFTGSLALVGTGTILQIGTGAASSTVIPDTVNVDVGAGAFFYFNTGAEAINGLSGSGTVQKHPGVGGLTTFTVGSGNATSVFTGAIANGGGTVALVKTGTGTQSLNGASSYTAGTTISQGVLQVGVGAGAGTGSVTLNDASTGANNTSFLATAVITVANPITIAAQGTGVSTIGTSDFAAGAGTFFTNTITANKAVTFQGGNTDRTTYQGQITGAGAITISSANPAGRRTTWENNTNNFTGSLALVGTGTILQIGTGAASSTVIPDTTDVDVGAGALFYFNTGAEAINGLSGSGTVQKHPAVGGTMNFTVGAGNATAAFAGVIANGSGVLSLTKAGTGTQTLTGASTYTGITRFNSGVISVPTLNAGTLASPIGAANGFNSNMVFDGGALQYTGATFNWVREVTLAAGGGTIDVANAATTLTIDSNFVSAGNDVMVGIGGLTKTGLGALQLNDANTFTGNVNVNAGTLRIGAQTALGALNTAVTKVNVASGATVDFNGVVDATYGYTIAGTGVGGAGALVNNGAAIGTGNAQTTNIRLAANASIGGTGNWALLTFGYAATTLDLNGFTLTKSGSNTFTLANTTVTAGALQIDGGVVTQIPNNKPGGHDLSAVAVSLANTAGASLALNNLNLAVGSLAGGGATGGGVSLGTGTLTVGALNTSTTYSGIISGTSGITKVGTGVLTLSGGSTFTGNVNVNAGTLRIGTQTAFGALNTAVTKVNVASGATVDFNGVVDATYGYTIAGTGVGGAGALVNNGAAIGTGNAQATNIRLAANASIGGTGNWALLTFGYSPTTLDLNGFTLTKSGSNTFTLANATVTAGSLQIDGGTFTQIGNNKPGGHDLSAVAVTLANTAGANLALNNLNLSVGSLAGGGAAGGNVGLGTGVLTVGALNTSTTYSGVISGGGGLTKVGTGVLTLAANNTFTGVVNVNAGTLRIGAQTALGALNTAVTKVNVASGATVDFNGIVDATYGYTIAGTGVGGLGALVNNGAAIGNGNAQTSNIRLAANASIGGTGNWALLTFGYSPTTLDLNGFTLTKSGSNTFTLANATVTAGALQIDGGTFTQIGNNKPGGHDLSAVAVTLANTAGANLTLNSLNLSVGSLAGGGGAGGNIGLGSGTLTVGALNASTNYGGVITGTGGLTKVGTGAQTLSGISTFSGNVLVSAGTLVAGASALTGGAFGAFNSAVTKVTVLNGATVDINGQGSSDFIYGMTLSGAGVGGAGALVNNGASGNTNFQQTPNLALAANATIGGTGNIYMINAGYSADSLNLNGFTLTKTGTNTFVLVTTTVSAGVLQIDSGTVAQSTFGGASNLSAASVVIANTAGATLALGGFGMTVASLAGGGPAGGSVTLGANTLTVIQSATTTFAGVISGTGGLVKSGSGALTLSGVNTYTGTTTINGGTLLITGSLANGVADPDVIVNNGGTLGGTGTVNGSIVVNSGGTVAPGLSPGVLNSGSVTWNAGSFYDVEINGLTLGTQYDQLNVTGTVALGGATLNLTGTHVPSSGSQQSFVIVNNDGTDAVTGQFAGLPEGSPVALGAGVLYITYGGGDGNDVVLNSQPIVNGTNGADNVVVTPTATGYDFQFAANPVVSVTGAVPFVFNGNGGDDYLLVNVNANTTPAITFDGGAQDFTSRTPNSLGDILGVQGTGAEVAVYTPSATTPGAGVVNVNGLINFTGLEPVDFASLATFTLLLPGANDVLTVDSGTDAATGLLPTVVLGGTSNAVAIETAHLRNIGTTTINTTTVDGDDAITLNAANGAALAANLSNLIVNTGAGATDVVNVNGAVTVTGDVTLTTRTIAFGGGSLTAGGANLVTLTASDAITDSAAGTDVTATSLVASAVNGISLDTNVVNLTATNTTAGGIDLSEVDALNVISISAAGQTVTLTAGGAITAGGVTEVTATTLAVSASGGIALDTALDNLTASNTTGGAIAISDVDGLTVSAGGVTNTGGAITLTTADNSATDDLVVNGVVNATGAVTLNAGDNASIMANLVATTSVAVNVDAADNDGAGGIFSLVLPATITAPTGAFLNGNADNDTFNFAPQTGAAITLDGLAPTTVPGDILNIDISALTNPLLTLQGQGAGTWTFDAPLQPVVYTSIENVIPDDAYHLRLLASGTSFGATGVADNIVIRRDNVVPTDLVIERTGVLNAPNDFVGVIFQGPLATILSFTYVGSGDDETLTIDDVNGLVNFSGLVPGSTGVGNNLNVADQPELFLDGGTGADQLVFALATTATDQVYGLGTGTAPGAQEGEVRTSVGATVLSTYFRNLDAVSSNDTSTPDTGALTIVGDANANAISIASVVGGTTVSATGYVPFTFGVQAFNSLTVNAGDGADTVTLASLNAGEANLAVTLNGEIGNDALVVESAPATSTVLLQGGAGNDGYNLGGSLNTVDGILAAVTIADSAGTDSLTLVDSADTSGDTVTITDSTINGVSLAPAPNVAFTGVEALDVTTSGEADTITTTLNGTNGLVSVNVRGAGGDDDFFLTTADGMATLTTLNLIGDAGSDDFGSATNPIRPLIGPATNIAVYGDSTAITTNPGGGITDHLFLDMTTTSALATVNPLVIVDTVTGQATSANTRLLRFGGIDDIDLYDGGVLTDVVIGDLYVRGTALADNLIFYSEMGGVRVNHNGVVVNNALYAPTNRIVAYGRAGADYMEFNFTLGSALGADFRGEADNDTLVGGLGADTLVGGGGADILRGGESNDILFGEDQFLASVANPDVQRATGVVQPGTIAGNDNLQGGGGNDILFGGGGDDVLAGGLGDDYVHGGDGNDILDSNGGNDILRGEAGADLISGSTGADIILGGSGDDRIFGRGNRDLMLGGIGADQLQDDDSENDVSVSGGLSYDADNAFTQPGASITGLNDNDLALQALMFTGGSAWTGAAAFATRVGAIAGSFSGMTNDGVMDIVIGTLGAEDYLVVNAADWQLNTLDDTIATL